MCSFRYQELLTLLINYYFPLLIATCKFLSKAHRLFWQGHWEYGSIGFSWVPFHITSDYNRNNLCPIRWSVIAPAYCECSSGWNGTLYSQRWVIPYEEMRGRREGGREGKGGTDSNAGFFHHENANFKTPWFYSASSSASSWPAHVFWVFVWAAEHHHSFLLLFRFCSVINYAQRLPAECSYNWCKSSGSQNEEPHGLCKLLSLGHCVPFIKWFSFPRPLAGVCIPKEILLTALLNKPTSPIQIQECTSLIQTCSFKKNHKKK